MPIVFAKSFEGDEPVEKFSADQPRRPKGPAGGQFAPKGGGGAADEAKPKDGYDHAGAQGELDRAKYGDHAPAHDTGHTVEGAWRAGGNEPGVGFGNRKLPPPQPSSFKTQQAWADAHDSSTPAEPHGLKNTGRKGPPEGNSKGSQIKALREQIKARNASKYDRMNQHGADPGMITSSIARANKKDRDAIKRLQAKISRFSD